MQEKYTKQINFKGEKDISFRLEQELGNSRKRRITSYNVLVSDENGSVVASQDTNDCFVVHYENERIVAVLRRVDDNGQKCFVPVNGVFAAIWSEQKKKKEQICFVWSHLNSDFYQHFEVKTYGFENKIIMQIFEYIFKNLMNFVYQVTKKDYGLLPTKTLFLESSNGENVDDKLQEAAQ